VSGKITGLTFRGEAVHFDQLFDEVVQVEIKESKLQGLKLSNIPPGIWIAPITEQVSCHVLTLQTWPDGEVQIEVETYVSQENRDIDLSPKKYLNALEEAIRQREEGFYDVRFNETRDFEPTWGVSWYIPLEKDMLIGEAIQLVDEVYGEIEALQWQIILEKAPHLRHQSTNSASIFLSHNRRDKAFTRKLAIDLRLHGIRVWLDEAEMLPGDSLIRKLERAIQEMDYLCVVLSPNSVNSEWVQREIEIALNEEIEGRQVKVIPLLYKRCDVPPFLRGKMYADCTTKSRYQKALKNIVRRIHSEKD
jgi:hypothetical protein